MDLTAGYALIPNLPILIRLSRLWVVGGPSTEAGGRECCLRYYGISRGMGRCALWGWALGGSTWISVLFLCCSSCGMPNSALCPEDISRRYLKIMSLVHPSLVSPPA
jgi:hypothetical protein